MSGDDESGRPGATEDRSSSTEDDGPGLTEGGPTVANAGSTAVPRKSAVATGKGDDGTTGLLFGGARVYKDDLRTEAYGTVDEAVAALGLARAELAMKRQYGNLPPALARLPDLILRFQRELFVVGAELATNPDARERQVPGQTRVTPDMVRGVDEVLAEMERHAPLPREFVVAGETRLSAALELARAVLRRAERRVVAVQRAGLLENEHLLAYVNRLADLVWVLARAAELGESRGATPSRAGGRRRATRDAAH